MLPHGQQPNAAGGAKSNAQANIQKSQDLIKAHMNQKVMVIDDVDRQVWELVSNVPTVNKPVAVV